MSQFDRIFDCGCFAYVHDDGSLLELETCDIHANAEKRIGVSLVDARNLAAALEYFLRQDGIELRYPNSTIPLLRAMEYVRDHPGERLLPNFIDG